MKLCQVPNCDRIHVALGYCDTHYKRHKRNGDCEGTVPIKTNTLMNTPIRSDNLERCGLSAGLEGNLCSLIRSLPPRKP
jgi:hypothetical protein